MKVVIPGGSSQVGTLLARWLHQRGTSVTVLGRQPVTARDLVQRASGQRRGR